MKRIGFFVYGVTGHVLFLGIYAWLAGFMGNLIVPHTIDSPAAGSAQAAIVIDLGLIALFGLQHSVMARPTFKRVWTRVVPTPIERATYVFASCAVTALLIWQWRPVNVVVWNVHGAAGRGLLYGLFACGLIMVPAVSLLIHHFDLFGTRQVWLFLRGCEYTSLPFRTPSLYNRIRHPLYVGWIITFWAAPTMTGGHLLFAGGMTAYILLAIVFEERNLVDHFGRQYEEYRSRTSGLLPWSGASLYIELRNWTWWAWVITDALLIAGLFGESRAFVAAMGLTAGQGLIVFIRERRLLAFSVQLRAAYLLLLLLCYLPSMRWLYWLPAAGTFARVAFGYCLLARVLSLLPSNGREPFTFERLRRTFLSAPDLTRVKIDRDVAGCPGGFCDMAAQVPPRMPTALFGSGEIA